MIILLQGPQPYLP